ncbi:MAG: ParB/RepB/Spo0J family partition protein [Chitinophagaceae bacterium]|jgi:ParB family chromosome partitioning protein|nr:ParB/RepB/Spo0J family partition protein [Chitinophagaceae bacterium]
MSKTDQKAMIGKGLRSLLANIDADLKTKDGHLKEEVVQKNTTVIRVPVGDIEVNPKQPRRDFDEQALQELSSSIRIHDIIQPLTVARLANGKYRLIAGERRWRASKMAGLADVPVYIRDGNDQQLLELSLLENLQREDLNAIEIALSYKRLMDELHYTQEEVAERMGKERSTVANYVRLLRLPPDIQVAVRNSIISMGHARALVNVDEVDKQLFIFKEVSGKGLSVRQTEELVRSLYKQGKAGVKPAAKPSLPPAFRKLEDNLASHFATKVTLKHAKAGNGSITIEYYSLQELNKILDLVGVKVQ